MKVRIRYLRVTETVSGLWRLLKAAADLPTGTVPGFR